MNMTSEVETSLETDKTNIEYRKSEDIFDAKTPTIFNTQVLHSKSSLRGNQKLSIEMQNKQ